MVGRFTPLLVRRRRGGQVMTDPRPCVPMPIVRYALVALAVLAFALPVHALTIDVPPSANTPVTTRGDGNGYEVTPANAYGLGVAQDINSGASNQTNTCVDTGSDAHFWAGFDF